MKNLRRYWLQSATLGVAVFLGSSLQSRAEDACSTLKSPQDVIDCALINHPEAQRAGLSVAQAENLESAAGQRPNPELSARSVLGWSQNGNVLNADVDLAHTIEVGGKRGARIERALAEKESVAASALRSREEVLLSTLRALYRLRQIRTELHTLDEALKTFGRIQKQFRTRGRLTPEQEVSLGVFDIAEGDYQLRKASLETELIARSREIELAIGREIPQSPEILPAKKDAWPDISKEADPNQFKGSAMNSARAGFQLAEAGLSLAQSQSWPNLRVGPSFQNQFQSGNTYQAYGLNLSFEIPLFHINGGGRAVARTGVDLADRSLKLRAREVTNQRSILLRRYENSVRVLKASFDSKDLEKRHRNTEAFFERGIITSSMVIETHRQLVDFTRNQNEQELSALESLWEIYILEGRAFQEKL